MKRTDGGEGTEEATLCWLIDSATPTRKGAF